MSSNIEDKYLSNNGFKASYLRSRPIQHKKTGKWGFTLMYHNSNLYTEPSKMISIVMPCRLHLHMKPRKLAYLVYIFIFILYIDIFGAYGAS